MKRSELELTGETYRLTPDNWGENYIMIDEDEVSRVTAEAFGISADDCDPDRDPNNRPDRVEIATDCEGQFYAILVPFQTRDHKKFNENLYRRCDNPAEATQGGVALHRGKWEKFDEEED